MANVNKDTLLNLLKDFNNLTSMKIVVFDQNGKEILAFPKENCIFCRMVKTSYDGYNNCIINDKYAFEICRKSKTPFTYKCHMNMTETVVPIFNGARILGYIMIGQFFEQNTGDFEILRYTVENYGLDVERAEREYASVPVFPSDKVSSAINILEACASYIYLSKQLEEQEETLSQKIERYIDDNILSDIDVDTVCTKFDIPRIQLYELFDKAFGTPIARFIKNKRVEIGKNLLSTTKLQVKKVSELSGFQDYNYFSKIFKRETGYSPKDYKRLFNPNFQ